MCLLFVNITKYTKQIDLKELYFVLAHGVRWVFSFDALGQGGTGHHCSYFHGDQEAQRE